MARRSPESAVKRARENALREKREVKRAKKEARAAARHLPVEAEAQDALGERSD
jgi:hypothetical protein